MERTKIEARSIGNFIGKYLRECAKAKEEWMIETCTENEQQEGVNQLKMYEKVVKLINRRKHNQNIAKKKKGGRWKLNEIKDRLNEYIRELLADERESGDS